MVWCERLDLLSVCVISKLLQNKEDKQARDSREQDKARVGQGVLLILDSVLFLEGYVDVFTGSWF